MNEPDSISAETTFYAVNNAQVSLSRRHSVIMCGVVIEQTVNGHTQTVVLASPNGELANELKEHILDGIRTYCGAKCDVHRNPRRSDA